MVKQYKIDKVNEIKEKLQKAEGFYLADYTGLTVAEFQELRRKLREAESKIVVTKNTMAAIAFKDLGKDAVVKYLEGPNAIVYAYGDSVQALKTVMEFFKEVKKGKVKVGEVDGEIVEGKALESIAKLPGKKELQAMVVGGLNSLLFRLVYALNWPIYSFVNVLEQIRKEKEEA